MKIIEQNTGKIVNIDMDTLCFQSSEQANKYEDTVNVGISILLSEQEKDSILDIILSRPDFDGYVKESEYNDWLQPDWQYRIYLSDMQISTIVSMPECVEWYYSLFEEPKNPYTKTSSGAIIYLNNIPSEAMQLLENMGVTIENKPII